MEREDDSVIAGSDDNLALVANVPHRAHNVCGIINEVFTITAPADDSMKRDLAIYELIHDKDHESKFFALFVRPEAQKKSACATFLAHYEVLKNAEGDVHLPSLVIAKPLKKLYFGADNIQQSEHDADWKRPAMVVKMSDHCVFLVALRTLSPSGNVGTLLALAVGYGLANALNSLHNKGFINRYVTPWNFMVPMPFSMKNIADRMMIMDLTLAKRWDPDTTSDASDRFVGTFKYSSLRALNRRTVGPADDMISVIFIVAELISGKLPWRSVSKIQKCTALRQKFTESIEFGRLPREIRKLYGELCNTSPADRPEAESVSGAFSSALNRRFGNDWSMMSTPDWLEMPDE